MLSLIVVYHLNNESQFPLSSHNLHLSTIKTFLLWIFKAKMTIPLILHISITKQRLYKNCVHCKLHKTIILQCTMYTLQNQIEASKWSNKMGSEVLMSGVAASTFKVCKKRQVLVLLTVTKHCYVDLCNPSYYWIWFLANPTHVSQQLALQVHRNNAWISNQKAKWHLGPSFGIMGGKRN